MTSKQKIEAAIVKLDAILLLDFITEPVREELTNVRTQLEDAKADL
tara:strand:+ start:866 stop:1003 length:138 start_codon:yes stop_codon:yes gene_type:complete